MLETGIQTYRQIKDLSAFYYAFLGPSSPYEDYLWSDCISSRLNYFSHIPGAGVGALLSSRLEDKKSEGEGVFLPLDGGRRAKDRRQISNLPVMAFHQV